jgi:hypothetical protein
MIWGKIAKAGGTTKGMDNGVPIDLAGGLVQELVNLKDNEKHDVLLLQIDWFFHL